MKLSALFDNAPDIEIKELTIDSREKCESGIFFCLEGLVHDAHDFIPMAIENGAKCIVHRKELTDMKQGIVYIRVENVNNTLNRVAHAFYGKPSADMKMFGITGTNGKSTIANIIRDIYSHFSPCGYIGTISVAYGDKVLPPTLTTPDTVTLHKTLKDMKDDGMKAVALEVSSIGLELGRVKSVDFDVAIFTNFTYDHLDFHGTMDNYFEAKKIMFEQMKPDGVSVLNKDIECFEELQKASTCRVITYGIKEEADYRADRIKIGITGSSFVLIHDGKEYEVKTNLVALYNIYNLLASIAAICESGSGISVEDVILYLNDLKQVEGRLERIDEGQPFNVIVDFAHTPDGLKQMFEYAKEITDNNRKIISVFGSAGRRDTKKRKQFGEVASEYCDMIILTEDDPRDESAAEIASEIKTGIHDTNNIFIENRYDAIRQAIEMANVGDSVLILGKGDEVFMYRENGRAPWLGDHNAAREIIRKYYLGIESEDDEDENYE